MKFASTYMAGCKRQWLPAATVRRYTSFTSLYVWWQRWQFHFRWENPTWLK